VLADIHEELSRKHRLRREVLDRKRKLIDEELKQVEEEMAELQNFGKLALQRVKEDRLRRMS
jgi:hypothetical protein